MVVSHVGSTIMPHVVMVDISAWGEVRMPIYDRFDVFRSRACICDFSCSSVTDLLCVWTRTFGCTLSVIDLRHWTDPLFQLQGIQRLVIQQHHYHLANEDHPSHAWIRLDRTKHCIFYQLQMTTMKMSSLTWALSVAVLCLRWVASIVMTVTLWARVSWCHCWQPISLLFFISILY